MTKEIREEARGRKGALESKGRKIHPSHFPVDVKVSLKDNGYNAMNKWVDLGNGKCKLVRRKS